MLRAPFFKNLSTDDLLGITLTNINTGGEIFGRQRNDAPPLRLDQGCSEYWGKLFKKTKTCSLQVCSSFVKLIAPPQKKKCLPKILFIYSARKKTLKTYLTTDGKHDFQENLQPWIRKKVSELCTIFTIINFT